LCLHILHRIVGTTLFPYTTLFRSLQPPQWKVRGLLGKPPPFRLNFHKFVAHPLAQRVQESPAIGAAVSLAQGHEVFEHDSRRSQALLVDCRPRLVEAVVVWSTAMTALPAACA